MSFTEMLEEIPKLSFAERQEIVRRALEVDDVLSPEDDALLDARMEDFRQNPDEGVPLENLKQHILGRLRE